MWYMVRAVYAAAPRWWSPRLLSLGLGIGINTGIFSMAVEFLFSNPSVTDVHSLVAIRVAGNSHEPKAVVDFIRSSGLFQDVVGENEENYINWNDGLETRQTLLR